MCFFKDPTLLGILHSEYISSDFYMCLGAVEIVVFSTSSFSGIFGHDTLVNISIPFSHLSFNFYMFLIFIATMSFLIIDDSF